MRRVYERRQCSCLLIPFDLWSKIVVYQKVHSRNNCSLSGLWELQTWLRRPLEYSRLDRSSLGQRPSACAGILWKAGSFLLAILRGRTANNVCDCDRHQRRRLNSPFYANNWHDTLPFFYLINLCFLGSLTGAVPSQSAIGSSTGHHLQSDPLPSQKPVPIAGLWQTNC
ncbi:hypothetical protein AcW1_008361 [Taiwanofungus camphoratus]|nr:hypothetical protein AcW1_008361 [Antrodia cinnamomea]